MSGLSERFIAQLESGEGNISLLRLAALCQALQISPSELLHGLGEPTRKGHIALLGLRGAGKSSVGVALSALLEMPFIELDSEIAKEAGLSLSEIFEVHGDAYYRRLESRVLESVLSKSEACIIATGGSIVCHEDNYQRLRQGTQCVWLKAAAQEHWDRVIEQGDARPMAKRPDAFAELRSLLKERESLYAQADKVVLTSGKKVSEVASEIATHASGNQCLA